MRSRDKKSKCAKAWKKWEAGYAKKEGGKEEAARERREFYWDRKSKKIDYKPTDAGDAPIDPKGVKKRNLGQNFK